MKTYTLIIFLVLGLGNIHQVSSQDLVEAEFLETLSTVSIIIMTGVIPENEVSLYKILYTTPDAMGQLDTASGLLGIPLVEGSRPIVAYQHGTVDGPEDVVSNQQATDELLVIGYSAFGNITSATDYIGLGESRGFHPYVHDRTQAQAGIDMMAASLKFVESLDNLSWNEQLFVSGYSQGGHGAMGMHRLLQNEYRGQYTVTASTPMSGPYSLSGVMRDLIDSEEPYGTAGYLPYVILGYQAVYGDLYNTLDEIFLEPYLTEIEKFGNREILLSDLNNSLVNLLTDIEGASIPKRMIIEEYYNDFSTDPNHILRIHLRENDNHNWKAAAPVRLFYCEEDEQIPFMNALVARDTMNALGSTDVQAMCMSKTLGHAQCAIPSTLASINYFKSLTIVTDVEFIEALEGISIGPNPSSDYLTITSDNSVSLDQISLVSITGQLYYTVIKPQSADLTLDVSGLPDGMYFLKLSSEEKTSINKISVFK